MAVVAGEIGVNERGGDPVRFFGCAADASENLSAEVPERVGGDMNSHVSAICAFRPAGNTVVSAAPRDRFTGRLAAGGTRTKFAKGAAPV